MPPRLLALLAAVASLPLGAAPTAMHSLDDAWKFALNPVGPEADASAITTAGWRTLNLPHDWSIEQPYSPKNKPQNSWLPGGVGVYQKTFVAPAGWRDAKVLVRFDAVYMNSTVWLNGKKVGGRPYGFSSFTCDLTAYLRDGDNTLTVLADNSQSPTSRFYHGGGIYGHADLLVLPKTHLVPNGGVFARTRSLDTASAEIALDTEVANDAPADAAVTITHRLRDAAGKVVAETTPGSLTVAAGQVGKAATTLRVAHPQPWSPASPYLYSLETTVARGAEILDQKVTPYGIRTATFDAKTGFSLNGKTLKLRGVCDHYVATPVGRAMSRSFIEWRLRLLKEMGCNAVRTAHCPCPPEFYDAADRIGIMVMDEIFDGWSKKDANDYGGRFFEQWWKTDTADWVRRDRNHPSVILWSIGNETGHHDKHNITGLIHTLDDSRPTTGGTVSSGVDVAGFNAPGELPGYLEDFRRKNPDRAVVLTEVPHTLQTRGHYRALTWWRDPGAPVFPIPDYADEEIFFDGHPRENSSYDNAGVRCSARTALVRTNAMPWVSGEFRWTGFDCLGEAHYVGVEFPKRIYNCGVIDLAGFPKDHFHFYRSRWTESPMVHLLPHWTHPAMKPGTVVPVVAYSNATEVELFLNGQSLGRQKQSPLLEFVWKVPYAPGELRAVAYDAAGKTVATAAHATAGAPERLALTLARPGDKELALLDIATVDAAGRPVPWTQNRIHFAVTGPARVLGYENGAQMDGTAHAEPFRNLFNGLARGFYELPAAGPAAEVLAAGCLGPKRFEEKTTVALDARRVALAGALPAAKLAIHYTTDGAEPTAQSPVYSGPFTLATTTTVKALVLRDGAPALRLSEEFVRGPRVKPPFDARFRNPKAPANNQPDTGPFQGPVDPELAGVWSDGFAKYRFEKNGTVVKLPAGETVAYWWYDFPDDPLEDRAFTGSGALRWKADNKTQKITLKTQRARKLRVGSDKKAPDWTRVE